ncbi:MAG: restriction endonuclease subunit S [Eubacteriales bacterium]|nr:restriction endonuclease subunit S [Eubacteriales bacterium]MDD4476344.1 restriction endonuclease subunit S [Eubacteriales bacterium]
MEQNKHIPQGYKDSPLGIIPQEWEVKRLGSIVNYKKGYAFKNSQYKKEGIRIIRISDTNSNGIKDGESIYLDLREYSNFCDYRIFANDIIIQTVGSRPPLYDSMVGKTIKVESKYNSCLLNQNLVLIRSKEIRHEILYALLKSRRYIYHIETIIQGNANQVSITLNDLFKYKIPLPSLPEQQKIAEILTCWDTAIEKQTQLIEKLETRKRGLMQQLLTGKKRLKGFEGEWRTVKLGEVGEISSAGVDKKSTEGELPIRLLNYLDVYRRDFLFSKEFNHRVTASADKIGKCSVKKGDIFFTPSSEVPNDIGISAIAMEDMPDVVYSYHVVRLRLHEDWDLKFRAYAFQTDMFYKQTKTLCDGSGQRYVISQNNFRKIRINVPSIDEQTAIADILSAIDEEIGKEKEKLAALKEQKRGLMQVLLTGKKRVKI